MGIRFRKSKKIAPGVKVNIGKKGASVTLGSKGIHHTVSTAGKKTTSIGVPGTGISYSKTSSNNENVSPSLDDISVNNLQKPPRKAGKKILIGFVIFIALAIIAVIAGTLFGKTPEEFVQSTIAKISAEPNTTERCDAIISAAKKDATSNAGLDEEKMCEQGIAYLKKHSENFYSSNEVMEMSIYFGTYIGEYIESQTKDYNALSDRQKFLYTAATKSANAIKYVYSGGETKEDALPTLKRALKDLNKLN